MQDITGAPAPRIRSIEELRNRNDPEAIKAVAREMESLFAHEMIKVMRESSGLSEKGGLGKDTYLSMFDMELSKILAERGLGLRDMFIKQLNAAIGKAGPEKDAGSAAAAYKPVPQAAKEHLREAQIAAILPEGVPHRVSSGYGLRQDPISGEEKFHHGLDIPAPTGSAVHPVKPGTVLFSGELGGYGNVVIIDHGDGYISKYAHNRENTVKSGDLVNTDSVIARVGSTGRSTGPHLHFEVVYQGKTVPPEALVVKG